VSEAPEGWKMAASASVRGAWITGGAAVLAALVTVGLESHRRTVQQSVDRSPGANVVQAGGDVNVRVEPGRRVVTPDGQQTIHGMLSGLAGTHIKIAAAMSDQEALALAEQMKSIFEKAGWVVEGVNQLELTRPLQGIILQVESDTGAPYARAEQVRQALGRAGLSVDHAELLDGLGDGLGLIVGAR
jgi:hypothetical protein